jgi:nitroreductase
MNIKRLLKTLASLAGFQRILFKSSSTSRLYRDLSMLSNDELLSRIRHESHRIEKAAYNKILFDAEKNSIYQVKRQMLGIMYRILKDRAYPTNEPTILWSRRIYDAFYTLEADFIQPNAFPAPAFDPSSAKAFMEFLRGRRSVRAWSGEQPDEYALRKIAYDMINAARWAPNSGNRQAWRFLIINNPREKELLRHIKENHCITAPLLIFVGMDSRVYGALGKSERSIFIDAGAAIMQMILLAYRCGLGACWNHLADDLISSREGNRRIYADFAKHFKIPKYITPIAIIAIGRAKFIPPTPSRMEIEALMLSDIVQKS